MIENVLDFFKNLPAKMCGTCGHEMVEQHDCYTNTCDECQEI